MSEVNCVIWNTPAEDISGVGDSVTFDSVRAGGKYSITGTAVAVLRPLGVKERIQLTSWLSEQRRYGVSIPEISSDTIRYIQARKSLSFSEKIATLLRITDKHIIKIGESVRLVIVDQELTPVGGEVMASCEIQDVEELDAFIRILGQTGLISTEDMLGEIEFAPTARGWAQIEELQSGGTDSSQTFVAMWFHPSTEDAYKSGIRPAIEEAGFRALRIDNKEHVNKVDDEIISEIRRSRFVVADFTSEPMKVRGGVYFEAGFARGLNLPVIWTCKETSVSDLHFDTRQYNHIVWKAADDLRVQLRNRIGALIGMGPLPKAGS